MSESHRKGEHLEVAANLLMTDVELHEEMTVIRKRYWDQPAKCLQEENKLLARVRMVKK